MIHGIRRGMLYLIARGDIAQTDVVHNEPIKIPFAAPGPLALGEDQLLGLCEEPEGLEIIPTAAVGAFVDEGCIFCRISGIGDVKQRYFQPSSELSFFVNVHSNSEHEIHTINTNWVQVGAKSWDLKKLT